MSLAKDEKTVAEWNTLSIPNPFEYLNNNLYLGGHLDNDMVLPTLSMVELTYINTSEDLATKFTSVCGNTNPHKSPARQVGAKSVPSQEEHTSMKVMDSLQIPPTSDTAQSTKEIVKLQNLKTTQTGRWILH